MVGLTITIDPVGSGSSSKADASRYKGIRSRLSVGTAALEQHVSHDQRPLSSRQLGVGQVPKGKR